MVSADEKKYVQIKVVGILEAHELTALSSLNCGVKFPIKRGIPNVVEASVGQGAPAQLTIPITAETCCTPLNPIFELKLNSKAATQYFA